MAKTNNDILASRMIGGPGFSVNTQDTTKETLISTFNTSTSGENNMIGRPNGDIKMKSNIYRMTQAEISKKMILFKQKKDELSWHQILENMEFFTLAQKKAVDTFCCYYLALPDSESVEFGKIVAGSIPRSGLIIGEAQYQQIISIFLQHIPL